jgi:hypothetical protein
MNKNFNIFLQIALKRLDILPFTDSENITKQEQVIF